MSTQKPPGLVERLRDEIRGQQRQIADLDAVLGKYMRAGKEMEAEVERLRETLTEVKLRMVTDFYTSTTGRDEDRRWACRVCGYTWQHGAQEIHEETCPLRALLGKE